MYNHDLMLCPQPVLGLDTMDISSSTSKRCKNSRQRSWSSSDTDSTAVPSAKRRRVTRAPSSPSYVPPVTDLSDIEGSDNIDSKTTSSSLSTPENQSTNVANESSSTSPPVAAVSSSTHTPSSSSCVPSSSCGVPIGSCSEGTELPSDPPVDVEFLFKLLLAADLYAIRSLAHLCALRIVADLDIDNIGKIALLTHGGTSDLMLIVGFPFHFAAMFS